MKENDEPIFVQLARPPGLHLLTGVDYGKGTHTHYHGNTEEVDCISFRIDGVTYTVTEDPDDGYRSSAGDVEVSDKPITNSFGPVIVRAEVYGVRGWDAETPEADILRLIDVETGGVVLEVGTSYSDSYYPACVMNFNPENLVHNAHLKTAPAGSR